MHLFVSVGTDFHPFDRVIDWVDELATSRPDIEVTVQYGESRAPRNGNGVQLLGRDEMGRKLRSADLVVISCGPGGVMDTRRAGKLPVVVPRRRSLGEHVDDHQHAFAAHLDDVGLARRIETIEEFMIVIAEAATNPGAFRVRDEPTQPIGIANVGRLIDELVRERPEP